jgi:hypothetical protein
MRNEIGSAMPQLLAHLATAQLLGNPQVVRTDIVPATGG